MAWLIVTSASKGKRPGFAAVSGIALGLAIIGAAAAAGLAQLATASPIVFDILAYAGVIYLLWLAVTAWRDASMRGKDFGPGTQPLWSWFRHGLSLNLLNPKAMVFFISVLPTFVVGGGSTTSQLVALTATYVTIATVIHAGLVAVAGHAHNWLVQGSRAETAGRTSAVMLVCTALWLLISLKQPFG